MSNDLQEPKYPAAIVGDNDVIECYAVNKWYGDYHALRDVTMSVKEREVWW